MKWLVLELYLHESSNLMGVVTIFTACVMRYHGGDCESRCFKDERELRCLGRPLVAVDGKHGCLSRLLQIINILEGDRVSR